MEISSVSNYQMQNQKRQTVNFEARTINGLVEVKGLGMTTSQAAEIRRSGLFAVPIEKYNQAKAFFVNGGSAFTFFKNLAK